MKNNEIELSSLGHTWLLDIDGTIVKHNGYKLDGKDSFLPGAKDFLDSIPEGDNIIFLTSRKREYKEFTENFLKENNIRYNAIIYDLPYGERILINDNKPGGLTMSHAISLKRDRGIDFAIKINEEL